MYSKFNQNHNCSIQIINNHEKLSDIKEDWNQLNSIQGPHLPYMCFEWFSLWLDHFYRQKDDLFIVVLSQNNKLVCIAPFLLKRQSYMGVRVRNLELIGNVYSPFRNIVFNRAEDEHKVEYLRTILFFLKNKFKKCDVISFKSIPEEKNSFKIIQKAAKKNILKHISSLSFGDWYLDDIRFSGEEYFSKLPKKIRKDVSYCKRRLKKLGDLEFKVVDKTNLINEYMDIYYDVYSKSWQKKEKVGPTFHRDLAELASKKGWLRLAFLFHDQKPISTQFWLTCNGTSYILKAVYDQSYKKFSPGKVLTAEMMKYVIDIDKVNVVDYVQGDEPYKKDWTPKRRERKDLIVYNNNLKGRLLFILSDKIIPIINKYQSLRNIKYFAKKIIHD